MLPSTGYFKAINCPFYESGTCDRPYCHFKHARREDVGVIGASGAAEVQQSGQPPREESRGSASRDGSSGGDRGAVGGAGGGANASDSEVLQQLVTEAVKKVLADRDGTVSETFPENVVSQVVEGLKPSLLRESAETTDDGSGSSSAIANRIELSTAVPKRSTCVYNPTPIAELRKRHLPTIVSYMPTRESRVAAKRKSSPDGTKGWQHGVGREVTELKYKPTAITSVTSDRETAQSYVPTCKIDAGSVNSYEDGGAADYLLKLKEPYCPKSKKRREEYVPRKVKAPLKSVGQLDEIAHSYDHYELESARTTAPRMLFVDDSQDSVFDYESKFSDDEPIVEEENEEASGTAVAKGTTKTTSPLYVNDERSRFGSNDRSRNDYSDEKENENKCLGKIGTVLGRRGTDETRENETPDGEIADESRDSGALRSSRLEETEALPEKETLENGMRDDAERNARDKEERDRRRRDSSTRDQRAKKERRRERRSSNDKGRSASRDKVKERSSRDSRRKKSSESRRDKDCHGGESEESSRRGERSKRRDRDSKEGRGRSRSSKREERSSSKRGEDRSRPKHRSNGDSLKRSRGTEDRSSSRRGKSSSGLRDKRPEDETNDEDGEYGDRVGVEEEGEEDNDNYDSESGAADADDYVDEDDDVVLNISDSDHDVQEECLKIFQEYQVTEQRKVATTKEALMSERDRTEPSHEEVGRKRVAHPSASMVVSRQIGHSQPARKLANPQQKMYERWRLMREAAAEKAAERAASETKAPRRRIIAEGSSGSPERSRYSKNASHDESTLVATCKSSSGNSGSGSGSGTGTGTGTGTVNANANANANANVGRGIEQHSQVNGSGNGNGNNGRGLVDSLNESESRISSTKVANRKDSEETNICTTGRIRIAHVPYARSLAMEKRKVAENVVGKVVEGRAALDNKTAAQTAKSGVRVAHVPQVVPQLIRPEPLQASTQKFPLNVRQYYVNAMHDVCVQIYTNAEDAAQRAVKEEFACHERCKALGVYKSSCLLAAHRLKKEVDPKGSSRFSGAGTDETSNNGGATTSGGMVSHEAVLNGRTKGSWSVLRNTKKSVTEFRGVPLYFMLKKWIMSEEQLRENGFPRPHPDGQKGRAKVYVINSRNQGILSKVPNERICGRCGQSYTVDKQGLAVRQENCIYHWGRKFTMRGESKYSCCQQYGSASGCCDAKSHVWEYVDYENLRGYVKTLPKDIPVEEQGVYALDCEMCYTTQGLELTRITVINDDRNVVFETLVKPQNPIIDYNTRFSGITEETMADVSTTLLDVQASLLTMFSDKTILVGHSLESDFKALKLLHDTVVDTSVMFPHKNGYPQKRALKNLCSEYLRKLIQNDVGGHDSKEDAVACMELILWKAKEEAKLQ